MPKTPVIISPIPSLKCNQCGHTWIPRKTTIKLCPRNECHSTHWNEPKIEKKEKKTK
jgi:hypothetical protein